MESGFLHYLTLPYLLEGAVIALEIWIISFALACVSGILLALIRNSKSLALLGYVVTFYVWVLRGTPILLQLLIWYNVLPLFDINISEYWTAIIALAVCFSAYMCEVFRGALISVHEGQVEAANSLGFGPIRTLWYFVMPQAFRVSLPTIMNFAILMLKDTSLTSLIAVSELTLRSNIIVARNFEYISVFGAALTIYLFLTSLLTIAQHVMEKNFDYSHREKGLMRRNASSDTVVNRTLNDYLTPSQENGNGSSVRLNNVSKYFGTNKVLDDISMSFKTGLTTCIMGPSGSGKSTLLRTINGLEPINSGSITVNGVEISNASNGGRWLSRYLAPFTVSKARVQARTSMIFQQFHLFQNRSVIDNLTLAPRIINKVERGVAEAEGENLLNLLKMGHLRNRMPQRLSGGEQQRIGILRALAVKPKTLLFDEPTSALDPERVGEVLDVMTQLAGAGGTMIVVTHEVEFARKCADWVIFLEDGKIIEEGPPKQVLENPESDRVARFIAGIG